MSLFGKILALFNVFGALALIALAGMDYGKRQAFAYSVVRHELVLRGLPLDSEERDPSRPEQERRLTREQGDPLVNQLSQKPLEDMFSQAGGNPVATQ